MRRRIDGLHNADHSSAECLLLLVGWSFARSAPPRKPSQPEGAAGGKSGQGPAPKKNTVSSSPQIALNVPRGTFSK